MKIVPFFILLFLMACSAPPRQLAPLKADATRPPPLPAPALVLEATHTPTPLALAPISGRLTYETSCGTPPNTADGRHGVDNPDVFAPDGLLVAFSQRAQAQVALLISTAEGETRATFPATQQGREFGIPSWSPDGQLLAFTEYDAAAGGGVVYVVGRDGTGLRPLATYDGFYHRVAWSPDGAAVAYSDAVPPVGDANIYTTDYHIYLVNTLSAATPTPQLAAVGCNPQWE